MNMDVLSEYCFINMGQSPASETYNNNALGLPFYQGNADFGEIHPKTRIWCSNPVKIANKDDLLISVRAPIGALNIATEKCCIGRGLAALTPKLEKCKTKYIYFAIQSQINFLIESGTGSTFKAINKNTLENLLIPVYSIDKQDEIVKILEKVNNIINKRKAQLLLLDNIVKSRFIEMFGVTNSYNLPIVSLGELSELITKGASPSWQGFSYIDDRTQTLFITSENVREGYIDLSFPKYIEDGFNDKQKRSVIHKGDFLINIVGASIGRAAQFNLDCKANMNQAAALVRINDKRIKDNYLLIYLNSEKAQRMYDLMKSDTGRANLSLKDISDLSILLPPIAQQEKFEKFFTLTNKSKF